MHENSKRSAETNKKENQEIRESKQKSITVAVDNSRSKASLGVDEDGNIDDIEFAHYVNKYKEHEQEHTSTNERAKYWKEYNENK
jgi:hypothetical protein